MKLKHILSLFLILALLSSSVSALSLDVSGGYRGEPVTVSTDKDALIIFRMNNGTPIYAYGKEAKFLPHVTGELRIEAIAGDEKAVKVIQITEKPEEQGGESGESGEAHYLPPDYRTALGALLKASELKGFSVDVSGGYVRGIGGIYEKSMGETSGWMYSVNGETPMVPASDYQLNAGDTLLWYFVRNYGDDPSSAPYKIEIRIHSDWSFDIQISPPMPWGVQEEQQEEAYESSAGETPSARGNENFVILNSTENALNLIVFQNASVKLNFTKIPLELNLNTKSPLELKVEKERASGIIFNDLHATPLECFNLELNRSGKVTLNFSISKEKLEELNASAHDVSLMKFDERWIQIPTELRGENQTHYFFSAEIQNFSLFVIAVEWKNFPLERTDEPIIRALEWLRSIQREDGGFANPDEEESSFSGTSWAIMAISSAGEDPHSWKKNGNSPLDYLRREIPERLDEMGTIDYARTVLALKASGENPRNFEGIDFVELLKERIKENGQIGDYIHTTIWGILALSSVGEDVSKSVEWLKSQQNEDGGFSWIPGGDSDFDDTAAAIQALIAGGEPRDSEVIQKALEYLRRGQNEDGGMSYEEGLQSNSASDAWTIQALVSAGVNPAEWKKGEKSVVEHLLELQEEDGHFRYSTDYDSNPGYMTVCAIMALLGEPHPVKPEFKETEVHGIEESAPVEETPAAEETKVTEAAETQKTPSRETPGFEALLAIFSIILISVMRRRG
ncbi:MAG: hypothetical protein PWR13_893 [Archaeoglobi archaeon]|nr:hypothetical protein [Archaeoglobi archaeon]